MQHIKKVVRAGDCPVIVAQWAEHCHLKSGRGSISGGYRLQVINSSVQELSTLLNCWRPSG